jgi:hypothetical protein
MFPFIPALSLGSGGFGGGLLSSVSSLPIVNTLTSGLTSTLTGAITNPIGTISSIGSAIGGIFSSNKGAVQLADRQSGQPNMQGVMLLLHDINQQKGGIWLAGEDCPWVGPDWNDNVTGIYIAPGFEFTFYDDINYGGKSFTISANDPIRKPNEPFYQNGAGQWWNDRLSSFRIRKVDNSAKSFPELMPVQKVSNPYISDDNIQKLGGKPMPTIDPVDISTNSLVDLPTSSESTTTTKTRSMNWLWVVLGLLGLGIYTKKIKL